MNAVNASDLRELLRDLKPAVPEPTWDLLVYCRFLSERLSASGAISGGDLAALAEELIGDLKSGVDRRSGSTFDPPLVSGRSDLVYNHFRSRLEVVAERAGGSEFMAAVAAGLRPVVPAPRPKAEEPKAEEPKAAPAG